MPDTPYTLDSLRLSGFRAYLSPKTFGFGTKRCLAVFAPNGKGKSSIIDALEFMFSIDGTLERLGLRTIHNNAGPTALAHNLAGEKGIDSHVRIQFRFGKDKLEALRIATGSNRACPPVADTVRKCFAVSPLIRGYELRRFVEEETAEQRYEDVARWLQLAPGIRFIKGMRAESPLHR